MIREVAAARSRGELRSLSLNNQCGHGYTRQHASNVDVADDLHQRLQPDSFGALDDLDPPLNQIPDIFLKDGDISYLAQGDQVQLLMRALLLPTPHMQFLNQFVSRTDAG